MLIHTCDHTGEEDERLDLDAHKAMEALKRDRRNEGFEIYRQDRHKEEVFDEDDPALHHVGGTWFKGLVEEIAAGKPVIDFNKMAGRSQFDSNEDDEIDDDDLLLIFDDILSFQKILNI